MNFPYSSFAVLAASAAFVQAAPHLRDMRPDLEGSTSYYPCLDQSDCMFSTGVWRCKRVGTDTCVTEDNKGGAVCVECTGDISEYCGASEEKIASEDTLQNAPHL